MVTNEGNDLREDMLVIVKSDLAKIGVSVQARTREWTVLLDEVKRKEFEAWLSGWVPDFRYEPRDLFHSETVDGPYNMVSFANPEADSLIDLGTSLTDREQAKPVWSAFQRILHREQPYTWLYTAEERLGVSRRVQGVQSDVRSPLFDVRRWWVSGG
jgi:peptide/nickel transport system substrate-binding protein